MLAKLSSKLFKGLDRQGENNHHSQFRDIWSQMSAFSKFCDLLPYDAYDPKTGLFYNQESVGFVIETAPLVGASIEMQKEVSNLFALALPEESSLQVLLWADPHIGDQLKDYQAARKGQSATLQDMARQRAEHLKRFAYDSPFKPYSLRNLRCFFSFAKPRDTSIRSDEELCERLKDQITTTLEMLGLPVQRLQASDLLTLVSGILDTASGEVDTQNLEWNPLQDLASQVSTNTLHLSVSEDGLSLNENSLKIRTYAPKSYPSQ